MKKRKNVRILNDKRSLFFHENICQERKKSQWGRRVLDHYQESGVCLTEREGGKGGDRGCFLILRNGQLMKKGFDLRRKGNRNKRENTSCGRLLETINRTYSARRGK